MPRLEFFFDYGSPYSYLASSRLPALVERTGAEVTYRPMLLGGVFKATGNSSPAVEPCEAKRAYGGLELRRWIAHLGVPFSGNPHFPINTLLLMRTAVAAQHAGWESLLRTGARGHRASMVAVAKQPGTAILVAPARAFPSTSARPVAKSARRSGLVCAP